MDDTTGVTEAIEHLARAVDRAAQTQPALKNTTLSFQFELPMERLELETIVKAGEAQSAISTALQLIRSRLKHGSPDEEETKLLEDIRGVLLDGCVEP